jgi:bifunctional DNA-binding transcriptional regulator/antitoxin component of YhaV-PrlF toxin-antitoxin module
MLPMNETSPIDRRSLSKTKTQQVWEIADRITAENGYRATRGQVIEASATEGINRSTASTQYHHWKRAWQSRQTPRSSTERTPEGKSAQVPLQVGKDGRLLIPAELRSQMMIGPKGKLTAWIEDGELRVISPLIALRRLQRLVRELDQGTGSPVDELLAERRAEALNE